MKVSEMCMLDILERERDAKNRMTVNGDELMRERSRENPNESFCTLYTMRRDVALKELNEARRDLRTYCTYYGIRYTGGY